MMKITEMRSNLELQEAIASGATVLAEFGAPWCPPCKAIQPVLEELAAGEAGASARIVTVNVDEAPDAGAAYGVMSLPTVILFAGGEPVERLVGLRPREVYSALLAKHAATQAPEGEASAATAH